MSTKELSQRLLIPIPLVTAIKKESIRENLIEQNNGIALSLEGKDYVETLKEIASIVDGPISGEVKATTTDAEGMIAEGREIAKIHPNMVVKIPMTVEGLKAVKVLTAEGIKTNVTLIFNANQALLAARAGAHMYHHSLDVWTIFLQEE